MLSELVKQSEIFRDFSVQYGPGCSRVELGESGRLPIPGDDRYVDLGLVTDSVGVQETAPARCERAVAKS